VGRALRARLPSFCLSSPAPHPRQGQEVWAKLLLRMPLPQNVLLGKPKLLRLLPPPVTEQTRPPARKMEARARPRFSDGLASRPPVEARVEGYTDKAVLRQRETSCSRELDKRYTDDSELRPVPLNAKQANAGSTRQRNTIDSIRHMCMDVHSTNNGHLKRRSKKGDPSHAGLHAQEG